MLITNIIPQLQGDVSSGLSLLVKSLAGMTATKLTPEKRPFAFLFDWIHSIFHFNKIWSLDLWINLQI